MIHSRSSIRRLAARSARDRDAGRVLAAVVDHTRARFFEVTAAGVVELPSLQSLATRGGRFHSDRQDSPGWGEDAYHHRLREEERRHFGAVAERLAALDRERPATGVLLAGPGTTVHALERCLPHSLAQRLIGSAHLNPRQVTAARVFGAARRATAALEVATARSLVAAMEEGLGTGQASNGARETLRALAKGGVRTLLIPAGVSGTGVRCAGSGRLVLAAADCRGEGEPVRVADLSNAAMEDALRQGGTAVVIRDRDAAKRIDGLAALLRFP